MLKKLLKKRTENYRHLSACSYGLLLCILIIFCPISCIFFSVFSLWVFFWGICFLQCSLSCLGFEEGLGVWGCSLRLIIYIILCFCFSFLFGFWFFVCLCLALLVFSVHPHQSHFPRSKFLISFVFCYFSFFFFVLSFFYTFLNFRNLLSL